MNITLDKTMPSWVEFATQHGAHGKGYAVEELTTYCDGRTVIGLCCACGAKFTTGTRKTYEWRLVEVEK